MEKINATQSISSILEDIVKGLLKEYARLDMVLDRSQDEYIKKLQDAIGSVEGYIVEKKSKATRKIEKKVVEKVPIEKPVTPGTTATKLEKEVPTVPEKKAPTETVKKSEKPSTTKEKEVPPEVKEKKSEKKDSTKKPAKEKKAKKEDSKEELLKVVNILGGKIVGLTTEEYEKQRQELTAEYGSLVVVENKKMRMTFGDVLNASRADVLVRLKQVWNYLTHGSWNGKKEEDTTIKKNGGTKKAEQTLYRQHKKSISDLIKKDAWEEAHEYVRTINAQLRAVKS